MDMTEFIQPRSDQLNADDMIAGPMVVTIQDVTRGNAEQPVNVITAETPGRPYKPSKSMRRVMVAGWGKNTRDYIGKRMTLYCNPKIKFGGQEVGGIEISHMSGIDGPLKVSLTATRGKKKLHNVQPLADAQPPRQSRDWHAEIDQQATEDALRSLYEEIRGLGEVTAEINEHVRQARGKFAVPDDMVVNEETGEIHDNAA